MRHGLPLFPAELRAARVCHLALAAISQAHRRSVRRVRAWLRAQSLVAFFLPQSPCHDPPLRAPENSRKTSAGSTLRALRNAGSRYSAPPAARDKRARLHLFPRGRASPSSRSAAEGPPGAPQWEYTSPECSPAPPLREELDAGLGKAFECCSMSFARCLVLLSTPREEAILPASDCQRGATWTRSRSRPGRTRRAVHERYAAGWTPVSRSVSAPIRSAVRRVLQAAQKSACCCGSDKGWSRQSR